MHFLPWEQVSEAAERAFERHATRIRAAIPDAILEHVGSTSIPGAITKGDMDLQVRVDPERFAAAEAALAKLYPRNTGSTRTESFAAFEEKGQPDVGIQLTAIGGPFDFFHELRDRLRGDVVAFEAYQGLKTLYEGAPMASWRAAKERFFEALLRGTANCTPTVAGGSGERLVEAARRAAEGADPAHDFAHVLRVVSSAGRIAEAEGADREIATTAALLHELFNHPKGHPESHLSGERCSELALALLIDEGWPVARAEAVAYAIRVHPFSLGVVPVTLEGKVVQDADRLDSIGAIGIARCFATTSTMKRPFYDPEDPFCARREPDDKRWGVDHFYRKLLRIPDVLHTATARRLAAERAGFMERFLEQLGSEL
ncbi:metal-dependent phosphohydrolase [Vulgatibacter incomptus]|uniref:Metal-dependent phosphohydrolase n=1 Tax=Vulgatibacter incomptus TaxID=1391653 RepID=A0A0K1PF24_9BACT|nr:metal-dependent phosphohydrolase [Vulgatibacter incomptus]